MTRPESSLAATAASPTPLAPASSWKQRAFGHLGWVRGAIGAGIGLLVSGALTWLFMQELLGFLPGAVSSALPFLIPPLGASAVLVFCVPASPLAQPWPVVGGNLIGAAIGLAVGTALAPLLGGFPWIAAAVAVAVAIAAMALASCLHPPGGACALVCALGAAGPSAWGADYMLPIAANVLALCATGWLYNKLTGHPWPHHAKSLPLTPALAPLPHAAYTRDDIAAVMAEWEEVLDVDVDDLDAFMQAVLTRAGRPR